MTTKSKQQLESRRERLVASLGRADQFVVQYNEERDKLEVAVRLQHLGSIYDGMEETQMALEDMESDEKERVRNMEIRADFESLFFKIKAFLLSKIPPPITAQDNLPRNAAPPTLTGLKLPTISLPEFSGDYKDWLAFHDTFDALIHTNADVVDIQKFHYLKAALKGEAAQLIESFSISSANYRLAWEALVNRYANEYLLKKRHLQALFESPKMQTESASSLHGIVDEFERHVKILEQLGEPIASWSSMLEHLLCTRLHDDTIKVWEDYASTIKKPTYSNLIDFLQRRMRVLESISVNHQLSSVPPSTSHNMPKRSGQTKYFSHAAVENHPAKCYACDQHHPLIKCWKFGKMSLAERVNLVNAKRLCLNCFRSDHYARNCSSKYSCKVCKKRHHSLLHSFVNNANRSEADQNPSPYTRVPSMPVHANMMPNATPICSESTTSNSYDAEYSFPMREDSKNTFMLTALLLVVDCYGNEHLARALLDCGSQPNLISERMAQILRLKRKRVNVLIHGVGNKPQQTTEAVSTEIRSRKENFALKMDFLVLDKIMPHLPVQNIPVDHWKLPENVFLADPNFNKCSGIDLIIGNEHFFSCFKNADRMQLSKSLPLLVDSVFGWLVSGSADITRSNNENSSCSVTAVSLVALEESIERFWKIEDLPSQPIYSKEEKQCEEIYSATVTRNVTGRYIVRLPRNSNFDEMVGDSKNSALRRYLMLEKRLERDSALKEEYLRFMKEYIDLGHMKAVQNNEPQNSNCCFLPHHPVIKDSSTTTKVRVVFDASAKTSTGYSLNEALLVGPVIQDDLLAIILRFRTFPVAVVADIEKMYRQILVHPNDTPYQRILWRFNSCDPIRTYELQTVTYGLGPSSFLATRTLLQLSHDEGKSYPRGGPALQNGFYMDDFIGGAQSIEDAHLLRQELSELLKRGGFNLRKWTSNKLEVLRDLPEDQIGTQSALKFDKDETVKALGILWEPQHDSLRFDANVKREEGTITKRKILSTIARLFDPLGLIAPVIIQGKILMQLIWMESCGWDDDLPSGIVAKWERFYTRLPILNNFRIKRYAMLPRSRIQLHTFSDASEVAYGACTYVRCTDTVGNISVQLLAAKSRVAPLKQISLPRLELCAATLGAKLHARILQALQIEMSSSFLWSDSTVTLQWIKASPNTWKTFIANRVAEIQNLTRVSQWNHVAGKQNPADLVSRGMGADEFINNATWQHGPHWLASPENLWPKSNIASYPENGKERRKIVVTLTATQSQVNPHFSRFSNYNRLVRVTAYCLRFIKRLRTKITQQFPESDALEDSSLTLIEFNAAESLLIQLTQADTFNEEIRDLKRNKAVSKRSSTRLMCPFLDPDGVIRVGGRLRLSDQPYITKHPILLPSIHPFTRLLATHYHLKLIHGGGRITLSTMREKYWPINGRRLVRSIIRQCYRCARASPVPASQQMGQLPTPRITQSRPFSITGVDYAGPIYLKPVHRRAAAMKAYISIFICLCTKAVHVELVSDLSTPAFLAALRRFIARRGRPSDMFSDNGKNFEGAKNHLQEVYDLLTKETCNISPFCTNEGITWHMNPPKAPHFGGLWEAAVKVAKKHLHRQLGNIRLSFEDMSTLLTQIEASMNSRPLVPMSEDPNDLACLTPAHFLIGTTMQTVAEIDMRNIPLNRLDHYQKIQQAYQQFWHHWRKEYLQEMQRCTMQRQPNNEIYVGRLVVIVEEFQHPVKWPMGRIIATHPGPDKLVRVVILQTARGVLKRPITKICLLPSDSPNTSNTVNTESNNVTQ